jgi:hypothetical protein
LYFAILAMPVLGYIASSAVPEFPGVPAINSIWFFSLEIPLCPIEKIMTQRYFILQSTKLLDMR